MSEQNRSKINTLLRDWPQGAVYVTSWLNHQDYSNQLLTRYKESAWLDPLGTGAWVRSGDIPGYEGGLYALQHQLGLSIHPGSKTALSLLGKAHYLELAQHKAVFFGASGETLPGWMKKHDWGVRLDYHQTGFLPPDLALTDLELKTFSIKVSSAERAMLECLYLTPVQQELEECYQLMEGLTTLRPSIVQALLESCQSVKVKRLFLYLAESCQHEWFRLLDVNKIDLGSGKRSLIKDGTYIAPYQITVPKAWGQHEQPSL